MQYRHFCLLTFLYICITTITGQPQLGSRHFTTRDGLASNVANTLVQDSKGYLWIGTSCGLTRFDGYRFVNFYYEEQGKRQLHNITYITEDTVANRLLMCGNDYRVLGFDLQGMRFMQASNLQLPAEDNREERAMRRAAELGILPKAKIKRRHHNTHYALAKDGRELFVTLENGLYVYNPKTRQTDHYTSSDQQPVVQSDYLNDIICDRSGSVWIATTYAGICQLMLNEERMVVHLLKKEGTNREWGSVRTFCQTDSNTVLVATMDGRIATYNLHTQHQQNVYSSDVRTYAMTRDNRSRLWKGTRGKGVWAGSRHLNKADGLKAQQIYDILIATDGTVWIASLDAGLVEAHEQANGSFTFTTHLAHENVRDVEIDRKGCLWIATDGGLYRRGADGQFYLIYSNSSVYCVTHAPDGTIVAGTNGEGLLRLRETTGGKWSIEMTTTTDGLADNSVKSVVVNPNNIVIAATDDGISLMKTNGTAISNYRSSVTPVADVYNENATLMLADGCVLAGNMNGFVEIREPEKLLTKGTASPEPLITAVEVNDIPLYQDEYSNIQLAHTQNTVKLHFSSFNYNHLSTTVYSYRLEGFEQKWHNAGQESTALYNNLTPGSYRFLVRSSMANGGWSKETVCHITIAQPWWWTWWMRMLYVVILITFVLHEWYQYQQRLSLRRQLDQRLTMLYANANTSAANAQIKPVEENAPGDTKAETSMKDVKDKEFLAQMDRLILNNLLQETLDVNFLAANLCVSYSTLHRRVKKLTGMTVNEYIRKHRLAKAMQLLTQGHSVGAVAIDCGFNSPSYFTRCFKDEFGILPSEVG